jgi:hypothetical protein
MKILQKWGVLIFLLFFGTCSYGQLLEKGSLRGNFQLNGQIYKEDPDLGLDSASIPPEKFLTNAYANFIYTYEHFKVGFRYEAYLNTMRGYDSRYDGQGIPYKFFSYRNDDLEVIAGNYYEQFGNGLILRSYENKSLGYDNSLEGVKVKYQPHDALTLKGLIGRQRSFFDLGPGIVRGFDAEVNINRLFKTRSDAVTQYILGGSFVSKFQKDDNPVFKLPENVGAFSGRFTVNHKMLNFSGEYAYKINDPSTQNEYIYKSGNAFLLNASYSKSGFGVFLGLKRVDNMSFRSDRNATLNNLKINYLPPITKTHSYSLASMYPYATQPVGEMGLQTEVTYNIKRGSAIGGKYGTNISLNYSKIHSLSTTPKFDGTGYKSDFLAIGDELYFRDLNVKIHRKFSRSFKTSVKYLNIAYNKDVIQGMVGYGIIKAHIFIADMTYKLKPRESIRWELQHMSTKQDKGNWTMALLEYSVAPRWFISASDEYNYGNKSKNDRLHYYRINVGYKKGSNRFQIGYGRQREGIECIGGVCRRVPASSGLFISINSSF